MYQISGLLQASDHTTWHECFPCAFNFIDLGNETVQQACQQHEKFLKNQNCSEPHYGFIDHGLYGAQLAWWLRFFPPEQFMVVSSGQLRNPEERIQVRARPVSLELFQPPMLSQVYCAALRPQLCLTTREHPIHCSAVHVRKLLCSACCAAFAQIISIAGHHTASFV
ncbi:MAG: hypothetical protein HC767_03635 [Akkermansiaceae bacterium]|nr:hypothetical protein [Akkermansiaceae bacterium]